MRRTVIKVSVARMSRRRSWRDWWLVQGMWPGFGLANILRWKLPAPCENSPSNFERRLLHVVVKYFKYFLLL